MEEIRAFIAIKIPEVIIDKITRVQNDLKKPDSRIGWVKPANIHITLKFLGNINPQQIDEIAYQIGRAKDQFDPFSVKIKGVGVFPNPKRPRVIWIGAESENQTLKKVAQHIDRFVANVGFEPEKRDFKAHLTLGRVKGMQGIEEVMRILEQHQKFSGGSFTVDEIVLIQSELKPGGAVYTPLKQIKF